MNDPLRARRLPRFGSVVFVVPMLTISLRLADAYDRRFYDLPMLTPSLTSVNRVKVFFYVSIRGKIIKVPPSPPSDQVSKSTTSNS